MKDATVHAKVYTICFVVQVLVAYAIFDLTFWWGINKSYHRNIAFTHCKIMHDLAMELGKYSTKLVVHSCVSWKRKFNLEGLEE